jgi:ribose transport system substrate-binding protein
MRLQVRRISGGRWALIMGVGVALGLSACGSSGTGGTGGTSQSSGGATSGSAPSKTSTTIPLKVGSLTFDPSKYCGSKPMKVGLLDGFGGNTWRVQVRALNQKVLAACKNVSAVQYYNANLDSQKYANTLSSWAAQGFNLALAFPDFGPLSNPAYASAQRKGVKVGVSYLAKDDVVPTTVTANMAEDYRDTAQKFVKFLDDANSSTAQVILVGGPAGNTVDSSVLADMQATIKQTGADVKFLQDSPIVANWDTAKTAQALATAIAKYPNINGVVETSLFAAPAIFRAFKAAGKPLPTVVGQGSDQEVVCQVQDLVKADPKFNMLALDGSGNAPPLALAKTIAANQGIKAPELGPTDETTYFTLPVYIDTLRNQVPACDKSVPPTADLSMALSAQEVAALK